MTLDSQLIITDDAVLLTKEAAEQLAVFFAHSKECIHLKDFVTIMTTILADKTTTQVFYRKLEEETGRVAE